MFEEARRKLFIESLIKLSYEIIFFRNALNYLERMLKLTEKNIADRLKEEIKEEKETIPSQRTKEGMSPQLKYYYNNREKCKKKANDYYHLKKDLIKKKRNKKSTIKNLWSWYV